MDSKGVRAGVRPENHTVDLDGGNADIGHVRLAEGGDISLAVRHCMRPPIRTHVPIATCWVTCPCGAACLEQYRRSKRKREQNKGAAKQRIHVFPMFIGTLLRPSRNSAPQAKRFLNIGSG